MAKDRINEYSTTASNNTDIAGIGIQGTNAVSNFDGAFRTIMKHLAEMNSGASAIFDTFALCDPTDNTKKVRIDAGTVATATTRVLTMPNADVTVSAFSATYLDDVDASTMRTTIGAHDASNLTAGTVADARLPTSQAGKTFTSDVTVGSGDTSVVVKADGGIEISRAAGAAHVDFKNAAADDYDIRVGQNGTNLNVQTSGGGNLQVNGTRTILNDGGTHDISITGTAANATLVGSSTAMTKAPLSAAVPAGFIHVLGKNDDQGFFVMRIDKTTGAVTVLGTSW